MHIVEEKEFCEKVDPIFTEVFYRDQGCYIFTDATLYKIIVFDTSRADISDAIPMQLIIDSARHCGDSICYFKIISPQLREPDFYHVPLDDLELFYKWFNDELDRKTTKEKNEIFSEWNYRYPLRGDAGSVIIFSETGTWGIITHYCCKWGFIGGTNTFVSGLKRGLPDLEKQVFSFLFDFYVDCHFDKTNYLEQIILAGIRTDLEHVYGTETTKKMLAMKVEELFESSQMKGEISDYI
jgi:hypothetical protein